VNLESTAVGEWADEAPAAGTYAELPPGLSAEYVRIYEAARPLLQTRLNDFHTRVATQVALELLRRDGGDPRIVVPAIILHDVGWSVVPEELQRTAFGPGSTNAELNREHEVVGVRLARGILESVGYPPDLTEEVLRIVDRHDSQPASTTLEEAIVKDADKMYRVTKVGFVGALEQLVTLTPQEVHDFVAVRASNWFRAPSALAMARRELDARRLEYELDAATEAPVAPGPAPERPA
jgi:HD superfamily phosphohydrolase YqeK